MAKAAFSRAFSSGLQMRALAVRKGLCLSSPPSPGPSTMTIMCTGSFFAQQGRAFAMAFDGIFQFSLGSILVYQIKRFVCLSLLYMFQYYI